jgi:hypothetical protein
MKTDSRPRALDFNELALLVAREIDHALTLSKLADPSEKFHVTAVKIKLGSPPEALKTARAASGGKPAETISDANQPFLLKARYPPARDGWLFEFEFSPGPAPPRYRGSNGVWFSLPFQKLPTAADVVKGLPVRAIKGVSKTWAQKLRKIKIETVGDLISLPPSMIEQVIPRLRSSYILELRFKAILLNAVVPEIPVSEADMRSLHSLVGMPPQRLRELIGADRFSDTASEQLFNIISLLYTTLNTNELKRHLLKDLRPSTK